VGLCALFTQSRGGQLVFLTVFGVYFVRRFGVRKGLFVAVALALPILIFGGRSGAEDSTMERTEAWWTGLHLFTASPVFGVGNGQFTEHYYLTAHSSFILTAAEMGLPGMLLWTAIVYLALKIPIQALQARAAPVGESWALALLASITGLAVGSLFLSFAYKDALWIYVGLTGALFQAMRRHDPTFTVRFGLRDLAILGAVDLGLLVALVGYTGLKLGW
jgi:O-antigen ligase